MFVCVPIYSLPERCVVRRHCGCSIAELRHFLALRLRQLYAAATVLPVRLVVPLVIMLRVIAITARAQQCPVLRYCRQLIERPVFLLLIPPLLRALEVFNILEATDY